MTRVDRFGEDGMLGAQRILGSYVLKSFFLDNAMSRNSRGIMPYQEHARATIEIN